jgi:hypothetical protein
MDTNKRLIHQPTSTRFRNSKAAAKERYLERRVEIMKHVMNRLITRTSQNKSAKTRMPIGGRLIQGCTPR